MLYSIVILMYSDVEKSIYVCISLKTVEDASLVHWRCKECI